MSCVFRGIRQNWHKEITVNREQEVQGSHPVKTGIVNPIKGGGDVVKAVVETVTGTIDGVKVVLKEPLVKTP